MTSLLSKVSMRLGRGRDYKRSRASQRGLASERRFGSEVGSWSFMSGKDVGSCVIGAFRSSVNGTGNGRRARPENERGCASGVGLCQKADPQNAGANESFCFIIR